MSNKKRISKFQKKKLRSDFLKKYSVKTSQKHVLWFDFAENFIPKHWKEEIKKQALSKFDFEREYLNFPIPEIKEQPITFKTDRFTPAILGTNHLLLI